LNTCAIIVAAGNGRRFNDQVPKQFHLIAGKPVIYYSLKAFVDFNPNCKVILVLNKTWIDQWDKICKTNNIDIDHLVVEGGESRSESVYNALEIVEDNACVMIHDAVRPCLNPELIKKLYECFLLCGNAVPLLPISEAIRKVKKGKSKWTNRNHYHSVQTPQLFLSSDLKKAFENNQGIDCCDESELMEKNGAEIHVVPGDPENIKITYPLDFKLVGLILTQ